MPWQPFDDDSYRSRPKEVRGGIRAQSKRGRFGESWWAARWIAVLESLDLGGRLQRGRSYARQGQVVSIDITRGSVSARVQGTRDDPYDVSIKLRVLSPDQWRRVTDDISRQAIFAAKLLAGEMPADIEQAFEAAGVPLFPRIARELSTRCSCPDASNPCKHIAAVYYLLGEEFDRDPFLLFRLRGLEREELMALLEERRDNAAGAEGTPEDVAAQPPDWSSAGANDLEAVSEDVGAGDPERFWAKPAIPDGFCGPVDAPTAHAALVRRLGRFPFWRGETPLADALEDVYARASAHGFEVFVRAAPVDH